MNNLQYYYFTNTDNSNNYINTWVKDNSLKTSISYLDNFTITIDTTPPLIEAITLKSKDVLSLKEKNISFKITDNKSGVKRYFATINDNFILMKYDKKSHVIKHYLSDNKISVGKNILKLTVEDFTGNISQYTKTFIYKK